ncbi:MAG: D-glycero-beta-D-manno-heptose 1-phosphate adenylyltransferase [Selenomonadaceae bacterium]|nr:D-glycero-beta-D-manno-heptose 1-phosphate adenylyltransferase [Selenomonadaceae bacterium]MBR1858452.1 D-glycero-beta-D-manno-heptose 1-phosphate adenylyltransferase [Selenomonadaceae bacterium]
MLINRKDIVDLCNRLRDNDKKVVFTNGCFDILHVGHVRYLEAAKKFGDVLIIGLNSDSSVKRLKGINRPINNEQDRAEVLLALKSVNYVVIFDESTAEKLIAEVKPNIYVKGGDYTLETLPEAKIVQSYGGQVEFIPMVVGRSTTNIINKINEHK